MRNLLGASSRVTRLWLGGTPAVANASNTGIVGTINNTQNGTSWNTTGVFNHRGGDIGLLSINYSISSLIVPGNGVPTADWSVFLDWSADNITWNFHTNDTGFTSVSLTDTRTVNLVNIRNDGRQLFWRLTTSANASCTDPTDFSQISVTINSVGNFTFMS